MSKKIEKNYRDIAFGENRARLRLLRQFRLLVQEYFDNSTLNMLAGNYAEKQEACEARDAINLLKEKVYLIIRLADIKTSAVSTSSLALGIKGQNIDLILNMFNLGRHGIPHQAVIDYIDEAIDMYKSNRLKSFIRTVNPFFWISVLLNNSLNKLKKQSLGG